MGRSTELVQATRGPSAGRRWPWGAAAVVAGAVAGAAVAYAARRVQGTDDPDAVEPQQLRAVVDRRDGGRPPQA